ncbi:hypothetical protein EWB00_008019, partial [Schistosoma japonicum]
FKRKREPRSRQCESASGSDEGCCAQTCGHDVEPPNIIATREFDISSLLSAAAVR